MPKKEKDPFETFVLECPKENWFKMPNGFIQILPLMSNPEIRVVLYLIRHTWGYLNEEASFKKITMDEFRYGRKTMDGRRMDRGTKLSMPSIRKGIEDAIEHGLVEMKVDDRDGGRIKKYYKLKVTPKKKSAYTEKDFPVDGNRNYPEQRKTTKKDNSKRQGGRKSASRSCNGFFLDDWDKAFGARLRSVLVQYDSDLVASSDKRRGVRADTLAKNSSRLRNERNISKKRIKAVVEWLEGHCNDTYTPQMHKAEDFFEKWSKFEQAMLRSSNGRKSGIDEYLEGIEDDDED